MTGIRKEYLSTGGVICDNVQQRDSIKPILFSLLEIIPEQNF